VRLVTFLSVVYTKTPDNLFWTKPLRGREQCQRETVDRGVVLLVG
jgi:hypothetical protein